MGRAKRQRTRKKHRLHNADRLTVTQCLNSRDDHIKLFKYMHENRWHNETGLNIGEFSLTGRGVYTTRALKENDILIEIPLDVLITIETIENDVVFRMLLFEMFPGKKKCINTQCLLAFYVLYLKHHRRYLPYLDSIPRDFSVPFFCKEAELKGMPCEITNKIEAQRELVNGNYLLFQQGLKGRVCPCCSRDFEPTVMNLESFEWAFFAVNSRTVYLDHDIFEKQHSVIVLLKDKPTMALAPFLDLLNHSSAVETTLAVQKAATSNKIRESSAVYQLYTKTPVEKYEQIFISYGALDNIKLITEYGFALPNNKNDVLPLRLDEFEQQHRPFPWKIKAFIKLHAIDDHLNVGRECGFSHNLLLLFRLAYELARDSSIVGNDALLNKLIYAESVIMSEELTGFALKIIQYKVTSLRDNLCYFKEIEGNGQLSEFAGAYVFYLEETVRWLEGLETDILQ